MSQALLKFIFVTLVLDGFLILGVILGVRLYKNLNNAKHQEQGKVIQRIMKTYTVLQCVGWPVVVTFMGLLRFNKLVVRFLTPSIERYAICILRSLFLVFRYYVGFNSFIIAICRYCFIVFDQATRAVGVDKARKILLCASFGVPLLLAVLGETTVPMEIGWMFLSTADDRFQSPIYELANSLLPNLVINGVALFCRALFGVIFSNIGAGLIYLHIHIYGRRYVHKFYTFHVTYL